MSFLELIQSPPCSTAGCGLRGSFALAQDRADFCGIAWKPRTLCASRIGAETANDVVSSNSNQHFLSAQQKAVHSPILSFPSPYQAQQVGHIIEAKSPSLMNLVFCAITENLPAHSPVGLHQFPSSYHSLLWILGRTTCLYIFWKVMLPPITPSNSSTGLTQGRNVICLFVCFWLLVNYTSHKKSNSKAKACRLLPECWVETVGQSWGWKNTDQQVPTTFQRTCAIHCWDIWTIKDNLFWK